ncbi:MAG: hypothetical protein M3Z10_12025 [Gemmatimonadota bacterium]|nr:hypothetical protein [Gemmatimonadota bacterium]
MMPDDAGAARALVSGQFAGTRYSARALELLECALRFDDPEYMALLALPEGGTQLVGLVLFGTVAGARSVVKVHGVVARERDTAVALLDGVRQASEHSGERMIVAELPDDTPFALTSEALEASGFAEEGRVSDFVRDGVALRLFVRPLLTM